MRERGPGLIREGPILFVSGVSIGGARRSTIELARALTKRGIACAVLMRSTAQYSKWFDFLLRGLIKWGNRRYTRQLRNLLRFHGRRLRTHASESGLPLYSASVPENAYLELLRVLNPSVVVANSLPREAFRWMMDDTRDRSLPLVLYIRESHGLTHVSHSGLIPDLILVNTEHYARELAKLGVPSIFIPSAVDCSRAAIESSRSRVVLVNPHPMNRPEIVVALADSRPDIPCVLQQSWPLESSHLEAILREVSKRPNLEFRLPTEKPSEVYRDARLLVLPYPSGRPRVAIEALQNGLPLVAANQPGLAEVIGEGGRLVAPDGPVGEWIAAIEDLWDHQEEYDRMAEWSREHYLHGGPHAPDLVASSFERILVEQLSDHGQG